MNDTLTGLSVLVTRPRPQSDHLAARLHVAGARPWVLPLLEILPAALTPGDEACIAELDRYAGVICISAAAAELAVRLCADRWPQWPLHQTWYAVGPASGRPLQGWGLDLCVAAAGSSSETLLALPALQAVEGQRFLIFRGNGGRETLAETLRSRGAQVDYLEIYRRQPVHDDNTTLDAFLASPDVRVILATSGETVDQLLVHAGARAARVRQCPLVVVSGRLSAYARQQGFQQIHLAAGADDDAVMRCLHALLSTHFQSRAAQGVHD